MGVSGASCQLPITNNPMPKLPREFYTRSDVVRISRDLIGKRLMTR